MLAPLKLMDHGRGLIPVTLRAPAGGLGDRGDGRLGVTEGSGAVHHERRDDQTAADDERDEE